LEFAWIEHICWTEDWQFFRGDFADSQHFFDNSSPQFLLIVYLNNQSQCISNLQIALI